MLVLEVLLLGRSYEASLDTGEPEWPPHPARVFSALVSVAETGTADDAALQWLESLPPPVLHAPPASPARRQAFVVTNAIEPKGGHQVHLGRTSGSRTWSRSLPASSTSWLVWPSAEPPPELLARLEILARKVPYLGRSTSPALLSFSTELPAGACDPTYEPHVEGSQRLRVTHPGLLVELRAAFADPALERPRASWASYRAPADEHPVSSSPPAPPAYPHLITLGFQPGVALDGRHSMAVAAAFKAALRSRLEKPRAPEDDWSPLAGEALALVHGHYDHRIDPRRQCSVLALPVVGHEHAHGDLLGVAVAVSADLDPQVLGPLLRLFGLDREPGAGPRLSKLVVPGLGSFALQRPDGRRTLDPERWTAPATTWRSVLPIVLDRFPRRRYSPADVIADGCVWAGLDRPRQVEVHPAPRVSGAPHLTPRDRRRPEGPTPPAFHATLHFSRLQSGPVIVGHLRHLGLGLCLPDRRSVAA